MAVCKAILSFSVSLSCLIWNKLFPVIVIRAVIKNATVMIVFKILGSVHSCFKIFLLFFLCVFLKVSLDPIFV